MATLRYPQVWFTYGPSTSQDSVLEGAFASGATGIRLTFSYGTPQLQHERVQQVRRAARRQGVDAFIVADLQGGKCRFTAVESVPEVPVHEGVSVVLTSGPSDLTATPARLQVAPASYLAQMATGDIVVEGDGALLLRVADASVDSVTCIPAADGVIHPGRGLLVQKASFRPASVTSKDEQDLIALCASGGFDAVALSFISEADDVVRARSILGACGVDLPIVAKIETALGVTNAQAIAREADLLMAARGDLALTTPWVELHAGVDAIASAAQSTGTPWILATQVAEGLERFSFPTRAEICDLSSWFVKGAFGAMLSYETAFGPRPLVAIAAVAAVAARYRWAVPVDCKPGRIALAVRG
jgi:pyruvate kinase